MEMTMHHSNKSLSVLVMGAAFTASAVSLPAASEDLHSGTGNNLLGQSVLVAEGACGEGACGEGMCGTGVDDDSEKKKDHEGKCGGSS
jgi:uncharacterized low-complexity protein